MLCVLPVFKDDVDRLLNLLNWIREIGGCKDHEAVVVADAATPATSVFQIRNEAKGLFNTVQIITTEQSVAGWPEGPNELFLTAARFAKERNTHWLFLEPDAVPLRAGWLDRLDIQYRATGARYLGQIVPCHKPGLPTQHFTGVGIYPADAITDVETIVLQNPKVAFDISTAQVLVPKAKSCELLQHLWGEIGNPPTFAMKGIPGTGTFGIDYLRKDAVLFHRTKDGKLIQLLRQKAGIIRAIPNQFPFIQLGRFGDIILLLPAMKYLADTTGVRPKMIVSRDYASVLEGVSYVEAIPLSVHWWMGMPDARRYADTHFGGGTVLQCYANAWGIELKRWPSFMISMLDRTGVPVELFHDLPLVFDLRNHQREAAAIPKTNGRPYIAINTIGVSSPFPHGVKIRQMLQHLDDRITLVDLGRIHCHRIYDLMGVMDSAIGTITTDTATLHLAHGCPRPYIALTVDGWCSSTPRGNCQLEVKYSRFLSSLSEIIRVVETWL
jgi:hypothetical protein